MPKRQAPPIDSPLNVKVERGKLMVEIGIHTLARSASYSDWGNPYDQELKDYFRTFAIVDPEQFAKDVVCEMTREAENGASPLTDFIDKMMEEAINQGSLGIHEDEQRIKFDSFSPLETWAAPPPAEARER